MGDLFVNGGNGDKGRGWRVDDKRTLDYVAQGVLDYLRNTNRSYGSSSWMNEKFPELRRLFDGLFKKLTGAHVTDHWDDNQIRKAYEDKRKWGYRELRDARPLVTDRPLLGIVDGCSVLYAYSGRIATVQGRLLKLGFTGQNLEDYLRGLRLKHDPILLASKPGDQEDEAAMLRRWRHRVADGDEWHWPELDICNWVKDNFDTVVSDFDRIAEDARKTHEHL